ncbi:hypothetical protein [Azospirillum sp. A23]|uniref:hypothetical protein n=1 Tax=Azospirillum sp. A23 TaxID=3160608 RepID=UPI0036F297DF
MAKFEKIFGIPSTHVLKTEFRSRAGGQNESWTHEEYDEQGTLVARYESWAHTTIHGTPTSEGWKKFDPAGTLIVSGDKLPL